MPDKVPSIDYSSRDQEAIFNDILTVIPFYIDEWTQHNESDFGIALSRTFAFIADNLHYYIDRAVAEGSFIGAIKKETLIAQLRMIDYQMHRASAASVDMIFILNSKQTFNTKVALGTRVKNTVTTGETPVYFETIEDLIIYAETLGNEVVSGIVSETGDLPTDTGFPDAPDSFTENTVYYVSTPDKFYRVNVSGDWEVLMTPLYYPVEIGDYIYEVGAVEGESSEKVFDKAEGVINEQFVIPETPVIEDSEVVYVNEGAGFIEWDILDSWHDAEYNTKGVVLLTDANGNVTIEFGDDVRGKKLNTGDIPKSTYRLGGGKRGNVGASTCTVINTPDLIYKETDITIKVTASCTNPAQAAGGADDESIEDAKVNGPLSLRTINRAVTAEDFKILAEQVPGVDKAAIVVGANEALAWWGNSIASRGCCGCQVHVAIYPDGGGEASQALKDAVLVYLNARRIVCTQVFIQDPILIGINLKGTVYAYSNYETEIDANLEVALDTFFDSLANFGQSVNLSDVYAYFDGVEGVDHVDFTEITRQLVPDYLIRSGNWAVNDLMTGPTAVNEEWTVIFISATEFTVTGSISGANANGYINVPYTSIGNELWFTVVSGSEVPHVGDTFKLTQSPKIGNIVTEDGPQLPVRGVIDLTVVVLENKDSPN